MKLGEKRAILKPLKFRPKVWFNEAPLSSVKQLQNNRWRDWCRGAPLVTAHSGGGSSIERIRRPTCSGSRITVDAVGSDMAPHLSRQVVGVTCLLRIRRRTCNGSRITVDAVKSDMASHLSRHVVGVTHLMRG